MQKKRSKVLFAVVLTLILLSITATYYNTIVLRNFEIIDDVDESELLDE